MRLNLHRALLEKFAVSFNEQAGIFREVFRMNCETSYYKVLILLHVNKAMSLNPSKKVDGPESRPENQNLKVQKSFITV